MLHRGNLFLEYVRIPKDDNPPTSIVGYLTTQDRRFLQWENTPISAKRSPGKTEQETCDKLAELDTNIKSSAFAAAGSTTVEQRFVQWRDIYKASPT